MDSRRWNDELLISVGIPLLFLAIASSGYFWEAKKLFAIPTAAGIATLFALPRRRREPLAATT
jgi:hypothetical protein